MSAEVLAQSNLPRMQSVQPTIAQAGDVVKASGEHLDRANVKALYLTDGKHDIEVSIIEQRTGYILFKVPPQLAAGRLALMVLTTGETPRLIEEPVKVQIQETGADRT